jgi:hypothetical protein
MPILSFENTFSAAELKKLNWKSDQGEALRMVKLDRENFSAMKYKINKGYMTRKVVWQRNLP